MTPLEKNARRLVGLLVQTFPTGATCEDLRRQFEKDTSLVRHSFYNALNYAKEQCWIVGGGRDQPYNLNGDGSWREPITSIGEKLEKDQLEYLVDSQTQQIEELQGEVERLRDWSTGNGANGDANIALSSLVRIVGDSDASTRQRIKAAAAILGYKVHDDGVIGFVKGFLGSVCADAEIATDYRIEAGELLRRHEAPRVTPESVRPAYCAEPEGSETQRVEAWRRYLIDRRKWKLVMDSREERLKPDAPCPLSPGWADDLYADDFVPPLGWPPQAVFGPC